MKTYNSKTGYVKRTSTGECYEAKILYLGIHDSKDNYVDIDEEEYEEHLKAQEEKDNGNRNEIE